jgi:hypothetical protein
MVLLDDAPPDFIDKLFLPSPNHAQQIYDLRPLYLIATEGQQIRALRPLYLEQQRASIDAHCNLPTVLQPIVIAYAKPAPEDMWIDWLR